MTSPDPTVAELVARLRALGFGAPPPDASVKLEHLAPEVRNQLGGGGSGGIFLDADGVPYFDTTASGGGSIALDADGVPYVTGV